MTTVMICSWPKPFFQKIPASLADRHLSLAITSEAMGLALHQSCIPLRKQLRTPWQRKKKCGTKAELSN